MRLTAANQAITPASMWSVLSSRPMPSAKRRTARGLSRVTGKPRAHSKAKGCFSYPPVASMATSSTPCCWQKAANSAQPSGLLGKERVGPWGPIPASREKEETSTPQIILATVTCLVRAMESLATVRSCVTAAAVPKLPRGCLPEGVRAPSAARGVRDPEPLAATFSPQLVASIQIQGGSDHPLNRINVGVAGTEAEATAAPGGAGPLSRHPSSLPWGRLLETTNNQQSITPEPKAAHLIDIISLSLVALRSSIFFVSACDTFSSSSSPRFFSSS